MSHEKPGVNGAVMLLIKTIIDVPSLKDILWLHYFQKNPHLESSSKLIHGALE